MNIKRFRQVLAYIEAHQNEWEQSFCSSCFLAQANFVLHGEPRRVGHIEFNKPNPDDVAPELELSSKEAEWIYHSKRTLDDFRTIARRPFA